MPLVTDLRLAHDRRGSSNQPQHNGHLRYPDPQKLTRCWSTEHVNIAMTKLTNRRIPFLPTVASTSERVHSELARLFFLQSHREANQYFEARRQLAQNTVDWFHYKRAAF